jgi:hypothetical protein
MRISVQAWSPEYGAEVDVGPEEASAEDVDVTCEKRGWAPIGPKRWSPDGREIVFVDGTRRTDARIFVTPDGSGRAVPGVAGSIGVGAVACSPPPNRAAAAVPAHIAGTRVTRWLAVGGGVEAALTGGPGLEYGALPVAAFALEDLVLALHHQMRATEAALAVELAADDRVVFIDGPLAAMRPGPRPVIAMIKSHDRRYLGPDHEAILDALGCGERTPIFYFGGPHRARYSWYLRLCEVDAEMHGWHGLVRCEVPAAHTVAAAAALADLSAMLLPHYASEQHWDPRAPQNLVPVAGLERHLRHLLGDRSLAYRKIRAAARSANGGDRDV